MWSDERGRAFARFAERALLIIPFSCLNRHPHSHGVMGTRLAALIAMTSLLLDHDFSFGNGLIVCLSLSQVLRNFTNIYSSSFDFNAFVACLVIEAVISRLSNRMQYFASKASLNACLLLLACPPYLIVQSAVLTAAHLEHRLSSRYKLTSFERIVLQFLFSLVCNLSLSAHDPSPSLPLCFACSLLFHTTVLSALLLLIDQGGTTPLLHRIPKPLLLTGYCVGVAVPHLFALLHTNPAMWLLRFLAVGDRYLYIAYWLVVLLVSLPLIHACAKRSLVSTLVLRKLFHALAVLLFTPITLADPPLMVVAFGAAICLLLCAEVVAGARNSSAAERIEAFFALFTEYAAPRTLHHIYLVLGCALPVMVSAATGVHLGPSFSLVGVVSVGIGDAVVPHPHPHSLTPSPLLGRAGRVGVGQAAMAR